MRVALMYLRHLTVNDDDSDLSEICITDDENDDE